MYQFLTDKDVNNNNTSIQDKAEAVRFGDKYNMIKEFLKSWYSHLGRTGVVWSVFTIFIVLFLYKCPEILNNAYIGLIAYINEVPYLGNNIEPLSNEIRVVITVVGWVVMQYLLNCMNINILEIVNRLKHEYFMCACTTTVIGNILTVGYALYALIAKMLGYSLGVLFYNSTLWVLLLAYSIFSKIWIDFVKQSEKSN